MREGVQAYLETPDACEAEGPFPTFVGLQRLEVPASGGSAAKVLKVP